MFWCIICDMIKFTIGENQGNQRLDRFLKKYFAKSSLSHVYKLIRKDVKVNGRRKSPETLLEPGDEITIYISAEEAEAMQRKAKEVRAKKQFSVVYEDENILAVEKPFGLLTHGDGKEKKNHLANQVLDYLIAKGDYVPAEEKTFVPSPANRLDRNTTGLVLFGKTSAALRELNGMLRERGAIDKLYVTITSGRIEEAMRLKDEMTKDEKKNIVSISEDGGKLMDTEIFPLACSPDGRYTLVQVKINTGRTHQIRVQLAGAGHPIIGDTKYGSEKINQIVKKRYGLTTHLLHAGRIAFRNCREDGPLYYLQGKEITCPLPGNFARIKEDIFGKN